MRVLALVGPTGTGKTAVSLELAAALDAEIVCGDSRQLFRRLDVATGKAAAAARAARPHHLFDWLDVTDAPSAGRYARAASAVLAEIHGRGRLPLVVGGSGLYLRALSRGLAPVPPIPAEVRDRVRRELAARGPESLHDELATLDPLLAARLAQRDGQRIARGIEVARGTGRPLSAWLAAQPAEEEGNCLSGWLFVGLTLDRRILYERLDRRTEGFFASGLLAEVRDLLDRGAPPTAPGLRSLAYAQAVAHLAARLPLAEAVEHARRETRRYAKRQWTWWRHEGPRVGLCWIEAEERDSPGAIARRALELWQARAGAEARADGPPARRTRAPMP